MTRRPEPVTTAVIAMCIVYVLWLTWQAFTLPDRLFGPIPRPDTTQAVSR